jgi:iron complex transport system permease protein
MNAASARTTSKTRVSKRLTPRRLIAVLAALLVLLLAFSVLAIAVGSEHFSVTTIVRVITSEFSNTTEGTSPEQRMIILNIRLPRLIMAIVVGAAFSVAGAAYQALLRNPLADPGILGISTGAALGAIASIVFAESFPLSRPLAAFIGAAITTAAVYLLGQSRHGASSERLVLAGMIVNAFLSSMVIYLVTVASGLRQRSVFSWLIGDLSGEPRLLPIVALFVFLGIAIIYANARSLNLLMTGEEEALALGVEVERVKLMVYISASLITGAAVAASGVIGFVGLIIPHGVRLAGGSDNRLVVPGSMLAGGAFLLLADTMARTVIAPSEIHIGVITALVGAPVFVYLLRRTS